MSQPRPTDPHETKLSRRVAALSLPQKVRLLTGADFWSLHSEPAVGLRRMVVSDGPAGVRGESWDERQPSANVPSPTALAATWDEALAHQLGGLLAFEARRKGVQVLLTPAVNLQRSPYGGRHFEYFSEDPLLTARIGVAYVRGIQDGGVAATVKHFVANDSETQRMTLDVRVDERTLREVYLAPFEAIVRDAKVWAVMAAYNSVNGATMTESPLLQEVLRDEWGFDGVTMSDWFATRNIEAAANAGLDLAMPGPRGPWGDGLLDAVRGGRVAERTVDDKVLRLLRLAARVGALKGIPARSRPHRYTKAEVAAQLRRTAAAGFVLTRNERSTLPLERAGLRRVAVLGPNAEHPRALGGGSATVFPSYTVSPLAGIRAALAGTAKVSHTVGAHAHTRIPIARPQYLWRVDGNGHGVEVTFLGTDGSALATEARKRGSYMWLGSFSHELPTDEVAQVRLRTRIRATASGRYHIGASGIGRFRLRIDTEEIFDVDLQLPAEADVMEAMMVPPQRIHGVNLNAGQELDIALVHDVPPGTMSDGGFTVMQFNLQPPRRSDEDEIKRAVTLARGADAAVVVVGTNDEVESEGFDRTSLTLPGRQDELVTRVAAANPRTVVVVNSGSPVLLPWADQVAAILVTWFPGQEFGNALADVLLGMTDPGGRLPMTWPDTEENLPPTQPDKQGALTYHEGLHIGYRRHQSQRSTARYPFGHGLGYTTWDYLALDAPATATAGHELRVNVHLRNSGPRPGREVVQLYLNRPDSEVERPGRWLAGFATVEAAAGQKVVATVAIHPRAFRHWQIANGSWGVEPGTFHLEAGSSSVLLPLSTAVKFDPPHETIKTVKRSPARRTETPQARRGDQADGTRSAGRRPVII